MFTGNEELTLDQALTACRLAVTEEEHKLVSMGWNFRDTTDRPEGYAEFFSDYVARLHGSAMSTFSTEERRHIQFGWNLHWWRVDGIRPYQRDKVERWEDQLKQLIQRAEIDNVVLEINLRPVSPPVMGRYKMVGSARPVRGS